MSAQWKKHVRLLVVMPIGPDDNGADTIESIFQYIRSSVVILAIDDSKNPKTQQFLRNIDKRVVLLSSAGYQGIRGALWCNIANAYRYAYEHYNFELLLRIDTDALMIGKGSDDEAIKLFKKSPQIGMLGSYKFDCNGDKRNFKIVKRAMAKEYGARGLKNMSRRRTLRLWIKLAMKNNYQIGEHVLGAAAFYNPKLIRAMYEGGALEDTALFKDSVISEDHLFSMLTLAYNFKLEDFATGNMPMGLRWRGLPDSPQNLIRRHKKIIHSIKFWDAMDEKTIRQYYSERRQEFKQGHKRK